MTKKKIALWFMDFAYAVSDTWKKYYLAKLCLLGLCFIETYRHSEVYSYSEEEWITFHLCLMSFLLAIIMILRIIDFSHGLYGIGFYGMAFLLLCSEFFCGTYFPQIILWENEHIIVLTMAMIAISSTIRTVTKISRLPSKVIPCPVSHAGYGQASTAGEAQMIKEITDEEMNISVIHESGHAMMAYLLDEQIYSMNLFPTPHVKADVLSGIADAEKIKKMVFIFYAGAATEEVTFGKFSSGCTNGPGSDFVRAAELIKQYIVMTNPDVSKTLLDEELKEESIRLSKEWYQEAKEQLFSYQDTIEKLANQFKLKKTLTNKQIIRIIEEPKSKETT